MKTKVEEKLLMSSLSRLEILPLLSLDHWAVLPGSGDLSDFFLPFKSQNAPPACPHLLHPALPVQLLPVFPSSSTSAEPQWSVPAGQLLQLRTEPTAPNCGGGPQRHHCAKQLYRRGVSLSQRGGACLEALLIMGCDKNMIFYMRFGHFKYFFILWPTSKKYLVCFSLLFFSLTVTSECHYTVTQYFIIHTII